MIRGILFLILTCKLCLGAIQLNAGSSERIDLGDINALDSISQLSVMFWVKPLAINAFGGIINKSDSAPNNGWSVSRYSSESNLMVFVSSASVLGLGITTDHSYISNMWHQIVMIFDGTASGDANRLKLFVDGSQKTLNFTVAGVPANTGNCTNNLCYGASVAPSYVNFSSVILDDVVIVSRVLSSSEMERHRTAKLHLTVFNNEVYTPLDNIPLGQTTGSAIILDRSNNNRYGVGSGGLSVQGVGFSYP